jgi:hypothetical protein
MQRTTAFRFPYGLTTYYPVAPSGYILFIPAAMVLPSFTYPVMPYHVVGWSAGALRRMSA